MEKIYQEEFAQKVLNAEHPVVVDFYADWCGPCKMLSPVLDQLEDEFDDFEFVKVNIDGLSCKSVIKGNICDDESEEGGMYVAYNANFSRIRIDN